jgi:hypothetical protein
MESISAYQDILSREPEDRDVDWLGDRERVFHKDIEMYLTLFHWSAQGLDQTCR